MLAEVRHSLSYKEERLMDQVASQVLFLVVFILIMYMLLIRPQKKKERAINLMRSNLRVGDEIVTIGGICGRIVKTKDESLVIQVGADKVKFEVMRWAIARVVEPSDRPSASSRRRPVEDDDFEDDEPVEQKRRPKKMKKASVEDNAPEDDDDDDDDRE